MIISPKRRAVVEDPLPTFEWAAYEGAASYTVRVELLAGPPGPPVVFEKTTTPSFKPRSSLAPSLYVWSVVAYDTAGHALADHQGWTDEGYGFSIAKPK